MSQEKNPGKTHQEHALQHGQEHGRVHQVQEHEHHDKDHLGHEKHQAGEISPNEQRTEPHGSQAAKEATGITVYIDHKPYHAASDNFKGADLRKLCVPPIGPDKDIFRVVSGKGDDIKLADDDVVAINMCEAKHGRHFFSDTIVPSKDEIARRAYFIYQEEGCQPGRDAENWAKAESEIDTRTKK